MSTCGELEELVKNCNLAVMPHQDLAVLVSFAPSRKKLVHAKLEIKTPIGKLECRVIIILLFVWSQESYKVIIDKCGCIKLVKKKQEQKECETAK